MDYKEAYIIYFELEKEYPDYEITIHKYKGNGVYNVTVDVPLSGGYNMDVKLRDGKLMKKLISVWMGY